MGFLRGRQLGGELFVVVVLGCVAVSAPVRVAPGSRFRARSAFKWQGPVHTSKACFALDSNTSVWGSYGKVIRQAEV